MTMSQIIIIGGFTVEIQEIVNVRRCTNTMKLSVRPRKCDFYIFYVNVDEYVAVWEEFYLMLRCMNNTSDDEDIEDDTDPVRLVSLNEISLLK